MTAKKIDVPWTKEMEAAAALMVKEEIAKCHAIRSTNRQKAEAAVRRLYEVMKLKPVPCRWFKGPDDLLREFAKACGTGKPADYVDYYCDGQFSNWWFSRFDFARKYIRPDAVDNAVLDAMLEVGREVAGYLPADEACFMSEHPTVIKVDEQGRPHNTEGPAIAYPNGFEIYCVNGVLLSAQPNKHGVRPQDYVKHKDKLTPKMVDQEENAELRVILLQLYGMGRYLADSKAEKIDEIPADCPKYNHKSKTTGKVYPFGLRGARLWRRVNEHGDRVQAVELINSTAEIGGKRKTYWIGVTSQAETVEAAVAQSYGCTIADYQPQWET